MVQCISVPALGEQQLGIMEAARTGPPPRQCGARMVAAPKDAEHEVLLPAQQVAPRPLWAQLDARPELVLRGLQNRVFEILRLHRQISATEQLHSDQSTPCSSSATADYGGSNTDCGLHGHHPARLRPMHESC